MGINNKIGFFFNEIIIKIIMIRCKKKKEYFGCWMEDDVGCWMEDDVGCWILDFG
jgi:hypothetical protein